MKIGAVFVIFGALPFITACAIGPRPALTDKIQTEEQATEIAKKACDLYKGEAGHWSVNYDAGRWDVSFDRLKGQPFLISIKAADGTHGTCSYVEY
jgi:hypothetical protein